MARCVLAVATFSGSIVPGVYQSTGSSSSTRLRQLWVDYPLASSSREASNRVSFRRIEPESLGLNSDDVARSIDGDRDHGLSGVEDVLEALQARAAGFPRAAERTRRPATRCPGSAHAPRADVGAVGEHAAAVVGSRWSACGREELQSCSIGQMLCCRSAASCKSSSQRTRSLVVSDEQGLRWIESRLLNHIH